MFDPELLRQVFLDLSGEISTSWGDNRLAHLADKLRLVDGSLLPALPRMHWARWQNDSNRAAKLHLKFTVLRQAPDDAKVTHGNSCESKVLLDLVKKGEVVVGDRYYSLEYAYFGELRQLGASWVIRIRNNPRMETTEEMPLTDADRAAGFTWQGRVRLGDKWQGEPIRVVKVEVDGKTLQLVTDLEMEAELIALIYRYRWQIELFLKMVQEHPRLPPPHGGIARRRGHPDLQRTHRRLEVATSHRQTPRQAGHGTHPALPHGLRGTQRGHHVVSASKNPSLIHPGGTAAKEVAGDRRARIPSTGRGLGRLTPRNYRKSGIRELFYARPFSKQRACRTVLGSCLKSVFRMEYLFLPFSRNVGRNKSLAVERP